MEKFIIDRFEEQFAVLEREDCTTVDVHKDLIAGAQEGDVVIFEDGKYRIDSKETSERKELIAEKMRKLFEKE